MISLFVAVMITAVSMMYTKVLCGPPVRYDLGSRVWVKNLYSPRYGRAVVIKDVLKDGYLCTTQDGTEIKYEFEDLTDGLY